MPSKKKSTGSRPFPLRTPFDQLEDWRDSAALCNYSMNQFGVKAIAGIIEMIERPDGYVPEVVRVAKLGKQIKSERK